MRRLSEKRCSEKGSCVRRHHIMLQHILIAATAGWTAPSCKPFGGSCFNARTSPITAAVAEAPSAGGARLVYCDSLSKSYDGKRYQFRDISLDIASGQRVGLIGVNGVGKSTLMKCIAGLEDADTGSVGVEGRPVILYVEQEPARGQDTAGGAEWTVADALTEPMVAGPSASTPAALKTAAALRAVRAYWAANAAEEAKDPNAEALSARAMELMGDADGSWELDQDLEECAARLDVGSAEFRRRAVSSLSGGERKRVALAAALAQDADVLLLDEPTNHVSRTRAREHACARCCCYPLLLPPSSLAAAILSCCRHPLLLPPSSLAAASASENVTALDFPSSSPEAHDLLRISLTCCVIAAGLDGH